MLPSFSCVGGRPLSVSQSRWHPQACFAGDFSTTPSPLHRVDVGSCRGVAGVWWGATLMPPCSFIFFTPDRRFAKQWDSSILTPFLPCPPTGISEKRVLEVGGTKWYAQLVPFVTNFSVNIFMRVFPWCSGNVTGVCLFRYQEKGGMLSPGSSHGDPFRVSNVAVLSEYLDSQVQNSGFRECHNKYSSSRGAAEFVD